MNTNEDGGSRGPCSSCAGSSFRRRSKIAKNLSNSCSFVVLNLLLAKLFGLSLTVTHFTLRSSAVRKYGTLVEQIRLASLQSCGDVHVIDLNDALRKVVGPGAVFLFGSGDGFLGRIHHWGLWG